MPLSTAQTQQILKLVPSVVNSEQHAQMLELAERVAGLGHWLVSLKDDTLFWSDEIYRIHGVTPGEYQPDLESALGFYHPDDVEEVTAAVEYAIASKEPFEFECRIVRPSGDIRHVYSRSLVQVDDHGTATTIFGIFQDITERLEMEARLQEASDRYQSAVQASEAGIWDVKFDDGHFYLSPALRKIIGQPPDEPLSVEEFFERLHPNDRERAQSDLSSHIEGGEKYDSEYRFRRPDCRYVWLHSTGKVSHDASGKPVRMVGSILEVGHRKRDEKMREQVYRLLTSDETDADTRIQQLLRIGLRYLDLDIAIVSNIDDNDYVVRWVEDKFDNVSPDMQFELGNTYCVHTLKRNCVTSYWHAGKSEIADHPCYSNFGLEAYIGVAISVDGERYGTINFSSPDRREHPFGAREESFVAMLAQWISYEIRQQRNLDEVLSSREKLEQKERELDMIFNAVPVRIWYKDDDNNILRLNRVAAESMSSNVDEVEGKNTYDLFPEMAHKYHQDDLAVIQSGEPLINVVEEYTPLDGQRGWVRTDKVPFDDPISGDRRLIVVSQDITEAMEAQQTLEKQTELLTKSNKDLDDFAYIASHDLKAPMRGIQTLASFIEEDLADVASDETLEHLGLLKNRIERMDRMLADILAYSRAGKDTAEAAPVDCKVLVNEVFDWLDCRNRFELKIDGELPQVSVSRTSLQQVFLNLASNAVKHHDRDRGVITVSCDRDDESLVFDVCDDGPGIPERFQARVFRMFETLQRRDDVDTSGIGLAIVDRLVQSMGGKISLLPNGNNRGCHFRFTLPLSVELDGAVVA